MQSKCKQRSVEGSKAKARPQAGRNKSALCRPHRCTPDPTPPAAPGSACVDFESNKNSNPRFPGNSDWAWGHSWTTTMEALLIGPGATHCLGSEVDQAKEGQVKVLGPEVASTGPLQSTSSREPGVGNAPPSPPSAARVACPVQAVALRTLEPPGCGVPVISSVPGPRSAGGISAPVAWSVGLRCAVGSFSRPVVRWASLCRGVVRCVPRSLCGLLLASGLERSISGSPLGPDTPPLPPAPAPKGCGVFLFSAADESR